MPRGRVARMLGRAAGSSGSGTARRRLPGAGEPGAAPSPARPRAGRDRGKEGGGRQVDPVESLHLAPPRFCPGSPGGIPTTGDVAYTDPVATRSEFLPYGRKRTPVFPAVTVT